MGGATCTALKLVTVGSCYGSPMGVSCMHGTGVFVVCHQILCIPLSFAILVVVAFPITHPNPLLPHFHDKSPCCCLC
jgi:hypothetical protein